MASPMNCGKLTSMATMTSSSARQSATRAGELRRKARTPSKFRVLVRVSCGVNPLMGAAQAKPRYSNAQDLPLRLHPETRHGRGRHPAIHPLGRAFGNAHGAVAVEIGGGEKKLRRRAVRQMRDGGGHNVPTPTVFDCHRKSQRDAEVARLAG